VLVRGETGTGKEVLARAIHDLSGRSGAFVAINCGAIATNLVESELFGYRKGSFSGALHDHPGLVRSSHGGTLFLDEIGDLPSSAQAALLRVLQESEVMPVGGLRPELVNLRVVAATHRDLDDLVAQGAFRRDLLARLDGVTLDVPPLRDRREDVPLVIASLLHRLAPERYDVTFTPDAARALLDHTWPHNVRELEQALAGALAVSGVGAIARRHLPRALREATESVAQRELTGEERRHRDGLIEILRDHRGNLSAVARAMGKGRTQVVRWLERYGLDADEFRTD
jgi:transcriptional regulator with PAS, ATPase and Fis domain